MNQTRYVLLLLSKVIFIFVYGYSKCDGRL